MNLYYSLLAVLISFSSLAQDKKVCITVDDLPVVTGGIKGYQFRLHVTEELTSVFKEYGVPAIGYVNERKLYTNGLPDSLEIALLEVWLKSDLELGNHTFSHKNYHKATFEDYTEDILKGDKISKVLAAKYAKQISYFRHPYLRIGKSQTHADSLKSFLKRHGYIESPVTIDNSDYLFALAYTRAYTRKDDELMAQIAKDYIVYMEEKLLFYEELSLNLYNRVIDQTLLIHANYLNALHMDELLEMYQKHGYTFISQSEVLKDPAYKSEVTKYGNWGISWIDRWAMSKGVAKDYFRNDPPTPDYIIELTR